MTVLTEGKYAADFVVSEASGTRSRDAVTIAQSTVLEPGTVLGRLTATAKYVALDPAATTGAEVAAGLLRTGIDATTADVSAVALLRDAEVNGAELVWPDAITPEQKAAATAELAALGIIVR
jgi:hypothetical protein